RLVIPLISFLLFVLRLSGSTLFPYTTLFRSLTSPENPYFAKAVVNRVWKNYMGRGLVEAEDDLRATNPPTNRELLDALTADFVKIGRGTRLNSSHVAISYAVFCLKKKIHGPL